MLITDPRYLYIVLGGLMLLGCSGATGTRPVPVSIEKRDGKFQLFRDNISYLP